MSSMTLPETETNPTVPPLDTPYVRVALPISLDRLSKVLNGMVQRNPKASVFLKADEAVAYGVVMKVMDVIKKAGIDRVGMVTEPVGPGGS